MNRYTESRERSAEVLRAALALMGQHDAAVNPLTYAVWYEHLAGINPRLSAAIEECLLAEPRIGDETIARLYREHVGDPDEHAVRRASGELDRVMSGIEESAADTGSKAAWFGETLIGLEEALHSASGAALEPAIDRVLEGTAGLKDSAASLQRQVAASRLEIERLRLDLSRARDEALVDPLTRVFNRKAFDQRLAALLSQPAEPGVAHGVVMLDIDRFKDVNDTYGHVMGDRVLQAVAEVLRTLITDPAHTLARYGGEEFVVLLPGMPLAEATALAERCRERVKALKIRDRRTQSVALTVTISAGVTEVHADDDAAHLIHRADAALYAAKQAGRDRVRGA